MDTTTATITTIGIIALAAGFYRLLLRSSKDEPVNPTRIEFDSPVANERIQWAMTSTLSEAVTLPVEIVEDHQDYHPSTSLNYTAPDFNDSIVIEALANHINRVGPVREGIGTMLARDVHSGEWWPIRYRPGHDALGFWRVWLYQANGPGGKFCWHFHSVEQPRSRPVTITSAGLSGTMDQIKEVVYGRVA
jgi:hypothetical protein